MGYPFEDGAAVNAALDVFGRTGQQAQSGHQPAIA
jgi:hypothetical protein